MAQVTLTPGAFTREFDLSFTGPNVVQENIYGLVGFTNKGKAFVPTLISQYGDGFVPQFGGMNTNYMLPYAVKEITKNGTVALVTRVLGTDATLQLNSYFPLLFATSTTSAANISALSGKLLGVIRLRDEYLSGTVGIGLTGSATAFTLSVTGASLTGALSGFDGSASGSVTGLSIDSASPNFIGKKLGTDPVTPKAGDLLTSLYVERVFTWYTAATTAENTYYNDATYNGALTAVTTLATDAANVLTGSTDRTFGDFTEAVSPWVLSQNYNGVVYPLFRLHTFSDGTSANKDIKFSISNVVPASSTKPASFTLSVRRFSDTDGRPVVLEQFKNVTLISTDKNYIARVIGDTFETVDFTNGDILRNGDYESNSQYVYVEVSTNIPSDALPSGFSSIEYLYPAAGKDSAQLPMKITQVSNSLYSSSVFMGADLDTYGSQLVDNILAPLPVAAGAKQTQKSFLILGSGETSASASLTDYVLVTLTTTGNARDRQFTVPFSGGWDGINPNLSIADQQTSLSGAVISALNLISDRELFDFDVLACPDARLKAVQTQIEEVCRSRADAYALLDLGEKDSGKLAVTGSTYYGSIDSSYAGANGPWGKYYDPENDISLYVPPSIGALQSLSFTDKVAFPWFAAAGLNRGVITCFSDVYYRLRSEDEVIYHQEQINPFKFMKGQIVRYGQKTLQRVASDLQDENIRRMLIKVRKVILGISQKYAFEPSDPVTWAKLENEINLVLEDVRLKRGITIFKAIVDDTTNTQETRDRNEIYGKVALQATKTGETILIDFFLLGGSVTIDDL